MKQSELSSDGTAPINAGAAAVHLVAGHTTRDLTDAGYRVGGSVAYASIAARYLNLNMRIVTGFARDLVVGRLFDDFGLHVVNSPRTTTFVNRESNGARIQELLQRGTALTTHDIPPDWRRPDVLHVAPVFQEMDDAFVRWFDAGITGATLQGWIRSANTEGRVVPERVEYWIEILKCIDIAIFSGDDINHNSKWRDEILATVPLCIETTGSEGCVVYESRRTHRVPTPELEVDDSTGAGDVFATAFLAQYHEFQDPVAAARVANRIAGEFLADSSFREALTITKA